MSDLYWLAVAISIISYGGLSRRDSTYNKSDRIWIPLEFISVIAAAILSGNIIRGVITVIVLWLGNMLLWATIWGGSRGIRLNRNLDKINKQDPVPTLEDKAKSITITKGYASPALFQRELKINYKIARELTDRLSVQGIVEPEDGAKPRKLR